MATKKQMDYINDYNRQKYGRASLMVPNDDPEINLDALRAHATERGESLNGFVLRAIREQLKRDRDAEGVDNN